MTAEKRYTREELYDLVWTKPVSLLAPKLGISDRGLTKICDRHEIPTPGRGYWAKLEANKRVRKTPLPQTDSPAPRYIYIRATEQPSDPAMGAKAQAEDIERELSPVEIPRTFHSLHPIVAEWVAAHKQDQARQLRESRNRRNDWFAPRLREDLTERDRYRFLVTSAFLKAMEKLGASAKSGELRGKPALVICGETVECTIIEKMLQKHVQSHDQGWTAWPEFFNSNLAPSGFLRFTINSWSFSGRDFIETESRRAEDLLPKFIAHVMATGPLLVEQRKAREEWQRQFEKEQAERAEKERLARLDARRWEAFREMARNWEDSTRLRGFIGALQQAPKQHTLSAGEQDLETWIRWAEEKLMQMDPLAQGLESVLSKLEVCDSSDRY
ncbi:hypothetical protein D1224_10655 [Henriciella barbarensis]|uniref:Uncharacterized protein n=2 Tax=Henriciella TaxID=453849 RepID=A0A399R0G1_9PROT|nr:hypothetical protein [Henriciella barbarensis]RIJ24658.1 hypothetical protein D1224_10655 [Henriciella barbarensis]